MKEGQNKIFLMVKAKILILYDRVLNVCEKIFNTNMR